MNIFKKGGKKSFFDFTDIYMFNSKFRRLTGFLFAFYLASGPAIVHAETAPETIDSSTGQSDSDNGKLSIRSSSSGNDITYTLSYTAPQKADTENKKITVDFSKGFALSSLKRISWADGSTAVSPSVKITGYDKSDETTQSLAENGTDVLVSQPNVKSLTIDNVKNADDTDGGKERSIQIKGTADTDVLKDQKQSKISAKAALKNGTDSLLTSEADSYFLNQYDGISVKTDSDSVKDGDSVKVTVSGIKGTVTSANQKHKITITAPDELKSPKIDKSDIKISGGEVDDVKTDDKNTVVITFTNSRNEFSCEPFAVMYTCHTDKNGSGKVKAVISSVDQSSDKLIPKKEAETDISFKTKETEKPGEENPDKPDKPENPDDSEEKGNSDKGNTGGSGNSGSGNENSGSGNSGGSAPSPQKEQITINPAPSKKKTVKDAIKKAIKPVTDVVDSIGVNKVDSLLNLQDDDKDKTDQKSDRKKSPVLNVGMPIHLASGGDDILAQTDRNDPSEEEDSDPSDENSTDNDAADNKTDTEEGSEKQNSAADKGTDETMSNTSDSSPSKKKGIRQYIFIGAIAVAAAAVLAIIIALLKKV